MVFKKSKIGTRIGLVFIFFVTLVVGLSFYLSYYLNESVLKKQISNNIMAIAEAEEGAVYGFLEQAQSSARYMASDKLVQNTLAAVLEGKTDQLVALSDHLVKRKLPVSDSFIAISIVGLDGVVLASTYDKYIGANESNGDYYQEGKKKVYGESYVSDAFFHKRFNMSVVAVTAPIFASTTDKSIGMMVAYTAVSRLHDILSGQRQIDLGALTGKKGRQDALNVYVANKDGVIIASSRGGAPAFNEKALSEAVIQCKAFTEIQGVYQREDKEDVFAATMCFKNGWILVVEMPTSIALGEMKYIQMYSVLLGALIILLALFPVGMLANKIVSPIKDLVSMAGSIGSGNFAERINITSSDEIGDLAKAINFMAEKLQKTYGDLEEKTKRVAQEFVKAETQNKDLADAKKAMLNLLEDSQLFEESLRQEREQLDAIITSMTECLVVVDDQFKIVLSNPSASKLLGFSLAELKGKEIFSTFKVFKDDMLIKPEEFSLIQAVKTGKALTKNVDDNMYYETAFKVRFPVTLSVAPLITNGKIVGGILIFRDISEEKKLVVQAQERLADLEKFNELTIGREYKMIEIKKEIDHLKEKLAKQQGSSVS